MTYFVRLNGETLHNDPNNSRLYVPGEPPRFPDRAFNCLNYCFQHNIVRIGWPDTGDLRKPNREGALASGYTSQECKPHHREYLKSFVNIKEKSAILVPDKSRPGDIYIAQVTAPYHYFHDIPLAPYEYSHRVGVRWVRDQGGAPVRFAASELNIPIRGGFWLRAFHVLNESPSGRAAIPCIADTVKKWIA